MGRQDVLQGQTRGLTRGRRWEGKERESVHVQGNICKGSNFNYIINHCDLNLGCYISHMLSNEISPFLFPFHR